MDSGASPAGPPPAGAGPPPAGDGAGQAAGEAAGAALVQAVARQIERTLLGGERRYTRAQVAQATGVDRDRASRLWLAMGFAEVGDDEVVFTDGDIEALRVFDGLVTSGTIPLDAELPHARAMGQTLSRLADWQTREIMASAAERAPAQDGAERAMSAAEMAGALLPVVEDLQSYVWRRHLAAVADRILLASSGEQAAETMVVGFADIVGYTSRARSYDTEELAELLESFEEDTSETVVSNHGRVVKTLGDEVMFVTDTPRDAAEIAVTLTGPARSSRGLPPLRVGMATGEVLSRFGDIYGPVVNLAARLTSLARPETVLVDRELAAALRHDDHYELRARRPAAVRGYQHLRSWALRPRDDRTSPAR
jgi:adenylate cyclase